MCHYTHFNAEERELSRRFEDPCVSTQRIL